MSKEILLDAIKNAQNNSYSWNLYFFRMDKRSNNPYFVYKVKFKNTKYLPDYASNLLNATQHFQIETLCDVQDYDGENTKVSCDKLLLDNELIKTQWNNLHSAVSRATNKKFKEKIMGYILCADPIGIQSNAYQPITFVKIANPIISVNNKRSVAYIAKKTDDVLDTITDDIYRLYLTVDFIVLNNCLYSFNHSFEKMFNLENTLKKNKENMINRIIDTNAFDNDDDFKNYANKNTSSRMYIKLNDERVDKIKTKEGRIRVAEILNLPINDDGKFVFYNATQARLLIKYLCYKVIKDDETKDLLEVGTVIKVEV